MISILLFCLLAKFSTAQDAKEKIERACLNYLEGFYEGDTVKIKAALKPSLYKIGYWKNLAQIESLRKVDRVFEPRMKASERELLVEGWKSAIEKSRLTRKQSI